MAEAAQKSGLLAGKQVAFTGRLAVLSRAAAAELVASHGGEYVGGLSQETPSLLVVGAGGWPLSRDGRLTKKLRKARWLARQGCDVAILSEEEWLGQLHASAAQQLRSAYTASQLAEMLGVSRERLKLWSRMGLVRPVQVLDSLEYYEFQQVAGAKTLSDLVRAGVTTARLRQSLLQLRTWLKGVENPLHQLTVLQQEGHLLVRLENGQLAEPTGQLRFDFSAEPRLTALSVETEKVSAEDWFDRGCEAEEAGDFHTAAHAYREALLLGGPTADACFNLGNVLYALGQPAQAGERFRQAVELDPSFCESWNNLGAVLIELHDVDEALRAFRRSLHLNPHCADAQYNLADALDDLGREAEARRYWRAYLRSDPLGPWADHARLRLDETE